MPSNPTEAQIKRAREVTDAAVRRYIAALRRTDDHEYSVGEATVLIAQALSEADRLREAGLKLALEAGKLNIALDGMEKFRRQRVAVVTAMDEFRQALQETTHAG